MKIASVLIDSIVPTGGDAVVHIRVQYNATDEDLGYGIKAAVAIPNSSEMTVNEIVKASTAEARRVFAGLGTIPDSEYFQALSD